MLDDYMNSGLIPKVKIYVNGMINKANRIYSTMSSIAGKSSRREF